jgi:hypothetical protein
VKLGYIQRLLLPMNLRRRAEFLIPLFTILVFFFAPLVCPQFLSCLALGVGAVSLHGCTQAATGPALCLSQKVAKGVTVSILARAYSPARYPHARLALQS